MKPLKITTEDCKRCNGTGEQPNGFFGGEICIDCNGKGKTTKLMFEDKYFKCLSVCKSTTYPFEERPHEKDCDCKGTGYILPKKGDVRNVFDIYGGESRYVADWHRVEAGSNPAPPLQCPNCEKEVEHDLDADCRCQSCDYDFRDLKFRLTQDAEVKSVPEPFGVEDYKKCFICQKPYQIYGNGGLCDDCRIEHNLSEDSKIVICEGYYE